jgi:hypothetical protein
MIEMIIVILAVLIMVVSLIPGLPWATYDRDGSIGPIGYNLEGELDAVGFEYSLETVDSEGGGLIDLGGGIGSNFSISKRKSYPEVRGEFLDNIGILYNSYRTKEFQYELKMRSPPQDSGIIWEEVGNPSVALNVSLESDLIPWWPETGKRDLDVRIEMKEVDLWEQVSENERSSLSIHINKITLMAKVGYDTEMGEYTGEDKVLAERDTEMIFKESGDSESAGFSVSYPSGTEAAGFYVVVQGNMTDYWGRPELSPLSGKPNPINVFPISTGKVVKGVGIPLALPLILISSITAVAAVVVASFKERMMRALMIPAVLLSLLAPLWFFIGVRAAVDLLGERLAGAEEGLAWGPGILISLVGGLLLTAALAVNIIHYVRSSKEYEKQEQEGSADKKDQPVFKKSGESVPETGTAPVFKKI